jgi:hypothetical protein
MLMQFVQSVYCCCSVAVVKAELAARTGVAPGQLQLRDGQGREMDDDQAVGDDAQVTVLLKGGCGFYCNTCGYPCGCDVCTVQ